MCVCWIGTLDGKTGLFPFNFTERINDDGATSNDATKATAAAATTGAAPAVGTESTNEPAATTAHASAAPPAANGAAPPAATRGEGPAPPAPRVAGRNPLAASGGMDELAKRLALTKKDYSRKAAPLELERRNTAAVDGRLARSVDPLLSNTGRPAAPTFLARGGARGGAGVSRGFRGQQQQKRGAPELRTISFIV